MAVTDTGVRRRRQTTRIVAAAARQTPTEIEFASLNASVNAEAAWPASALPPGMRPAIASAAPIDSRAAARAPDGSAIPLRSTPFR